MRRNEHLIRMIRLCIAVFLIGALLGCDAFVRKFTRKRKKDVSTEEELVIVPQEYKTPGLSKSERYQQYYLFWKSWQDELSESLKSGTNRKKQISSAKEAIKNLELMQSLLQDNPRSLAE